MIDKPAKSALLIEVLRDEVIGQTLVFTRTKHGADKVVKSLHHAGLSAEAIHGNKSQNQRERVLGAFRAGKLKTLVATDIAARGIDVDGISHVINYDLPNMPESYVHRIGRTARAGAEGIAISFCDNEETRVPARHREADPDEDAGDRAAQRAARRGRRRIIGRSRSGPQRSQRQSPQRPAAAAQRRRQRPAAAAPHGISGQRNGQQGQQPRAGTARKTAPAPGRGKRAGQHRDGCLHAATATRAGRRR